MKKILSLLLAIIISLIITGCGKQNKEDIIKEFAKKASDVKGYQLEASMKLRNNDDTYNYDIVVSYKKKDKFRVSLMNKSNNHEQIILKNDSGVYVVTPSLNKSFKFQSRWPYDNSQSYILQSISNDLLKDKDVKMKKTKGGYIFTCKVNYKNNAKLEYQTVEISNNYVIKKVAVYSNNSVPEIEVKFKSVDMNAKFKKNYFELDENVNTSIDEEETEEQIKELDDAIYPMYLPSGTYLDTEKTVELDKGTRIIMTFAGNQSFMLVEESSIRNDELKVVPTSGDIGMVSDCVAVVGDSSVSWTSNNVDYYLVSNDLDKSELLEVAKSISVMPISK